MGEKAKKDWVALNKSGRNSVGCCTYLQVYLLVNTTALAPYITKDATKLYHPHGTDEKNRGKRRLRSSLPAQQLGGEGVGTQA
jgi:hypothetical protein